jgi:hypothetical protein
MDLDPSRLRRGEVIVAASSLLLAVFMFALPWYGLSSPLGKAAGELGVSTSLNGWHGLAHTHWLLVLTILVGLALVYLQATRPAPALPVSLSVIVTVLGLLTVLVLIYKVLINVPGANALIEAKVGAYLGLASAVAVTYGGYESIRREGIAARDEPREIETLRLGSPDGS